MVVTRTNKAGIIMNLTFVFLATKNAATPINEIDAMS